QRRVRIAHRYWQAEIDQACYAELRAGDAAWRNAGEMFELGFNVEGDAVEADPFSQPHADGGDLVFARPARASALHPNAHAPVADFALHVEARQCADEPAFEISDELCHVAPTLAQIDHHIGHALAGAVIGELAATPRLEDWEAVGDKQITRLGGNARGVE